MTKLWQKSTTKLHPFIEKYTTADDPTLDLVLMPYDIQGTMAHVKGLAKINILNKPELTKILAILKNLAKELKQGKITIKPEDEDGQTVIENYCVKHLGHLGKKIPTGRSRNDQVLTAIRLYCKDQIAQVKQSAVKLTNVLFSLAKKHQNLPFPGYTHTQQAMLTSLGHYFLSFVESLLDDLQLLDYIHHHIDQNPLGSAASFGVNLPLDRDFTTQELGFKKIQLNSLYCQNSRGKFESLMMEGLTQIMLTIGRLANDLILFTTQEFNFFHVTDQIVTGSSIMPQKRNLDVLEIMRGYVNVIIANHQMIQNLSKNLLSGYNRDLQLIKKPLIESFVIVKNSLEAMMIVLNNIEPNKKVIAAKITPAIFAADQATQLAKTKNIPFRQAYQIIAKQIQINSLSLVPDHLSLPLSPGAAGNLQLAKYKDRLKTYL